MIEYRELKESSREGWYIGLAVHIGSSMLARSNYEVFLAEIGGISETVEEVRSIGGRHIEIRANNAAVCHIADELLCALTEYPVLCDEHLMFLEMKQTRDLWDTMRIRERVDVCRNAGASILIARRDADKAANNPAIVREIISRFGWM